MKLLLKGATGVLLLSALPHSALRADIAQFDDVIVFGSQCVGLDCINGENFSFDTLRLKENNLRIHFQDTSNAGSFPTTDWRIIINDSTNGGANYFGIQNADIQEIPFRIKEGARADSLVVDQKNRIGIGTTTPITNLHLVSGNSPTVRLEQNGSQGFASATWDILGNETGLSVRQWVGSQTVNEVIIGSDGSFTVNGIDIMAKLADLESRINALEP
jgi:hypothetical protein